jgi:hypothetical protein
VSADLAANIEKAERAMQDTLRAALGSPTEQHKRLEALIDALDPRHAKGIDRTSAPYWRTSR